MATKVNRNMLGGSKINFQLIISAVCVMSSHKIMPTLIYYMDRIFMHGCVNIGKIKFVGSHGGHERSHSTHICMTGHKGAQVNTVI